MQNTKYPILLFLVAMALLVFASCKPEPVEYDNIPYIAVESVSSNTLTEFQDDLVITISYEDENGDLGFEDPDSLSIEVWDSRLSAPDLYHLQPLSPPETELFIRGTIDVVVESPFLLGNGTSETVNYSLRLRDREGNWSNQVVTEDITITE